ncbi:MAG: 50S ribosomal protein L17 [Clostridiales bacterium]|nr:50S ribosomal protein L17 [Clostridiales bacterium]
MANRKFSRTSAPRAALLRNQTTALLWNGKIVTTEAKAKEIRSIAEKLITLAVRTYKDVEVVEKQTRNAKQQVIKVEREQDKASKLHARRQIMSYLYDVRLVRGKDEKKDDFEERKVARHPVVEKLFREIAPKYDGRSGGYTTIHKLGPRRGDAAEMVVIELV